MRQNVGGWEEKHEEENKGEKGEKRKRRNSNNSRSLRRRRKRKKTKKTWAKEEEVAVRRRGRGRSLALLRQSPDLACSLRC